MTASEKNFVAYTLARIMTYSKKLEHFATLRRSHIQELQQFCDVRDVKIDFSKLGNVHLTEELKQLSEETLSELENSIEFQVANWLI